MTRGHLWVGLILLMALVPAGQAQVIEIGINFGPSGGGGFDDPINDESRDLGSSSAWGLTLDIDLNERVQFELMYSQSDTDLDRNDPFDTRPDETRVTHLHAGVLVEGEIERKTRPFMVFTGGLTEFDSESYGSESNPSFAIGLGVKHFFTGYFGIRFEGRAYGVFTNEGKFLGNCTPESAACIAYPDDSVMWLWDIKGGVYFAF